MYTVIGRCGEGILLSVLTVLSCLFVPPPFFLLSAKSQCGENNEHFINLPRAVKYTYTFNSDRGIFGTSSRVKSTSEICI